jgi:hypothetical protein
MRKKMNEDQLELEYLRYFYGEVDSALGPASDDVYDIIRDSYEGELPDSYKDE